MSRRIVALALFFIILGLSACGSYEETTPELLRPVSARVDTARVDYGPVAELRWHVGITRYWSHSLYFDQPISAFDMFYVEPGDIIVEGQLLARLDTTTLEEQIEELENRLETMRADMAHTNSIRQVAIDIMVAEGGSPQEIEWARMELQIERERQNLTISHSEDHLQTLRARLELSELRAPSDGVITYVTNISHGQHLSAAQPLLYFAEDDNEAFIEIVSFTLADFPSTGEGPPNPVPFVIRDAIMIEAHINGQVYELEYIPVAQNERPFRPVRLRIVPGHSYPAGLYVPVHFYYVNVKSAMRVPSNALFTTPGGAFVYRVIDGELVHTDIQIIVRTTTMSAVTGGLEVGDEVFVRP